MEGGKTRIYKQNLSRLIRLTDFFGITDSSGLIPLSQIRDNGIINNGPRQQEAAEPEPVKPKECRREEPKKRPSVIARLRAPLPACEKTVRENAERDI